MSRRGGRSGLTVEHGELFVADDVVALTSSTGLEFGVLNTIWKEGFTSKFELRS